MGEAEDRLYELALAGKTATKEYQDLLQTTQNYLRIQQSVDLQVEAGAVPAAQKMTMAVGGVAGAFGVAEGAAALFGEENEDVQKALLKVNGAMALAQGLQAVYNASLKEGALAKLADSVATGVQTAATTLLTYVTGGATVAARAYRVALLATGIGAVVVLVLALVSALQSQKESMEDVNGAIETQNKLLESSNKLISRSATLSEERAKAAGKAESELMRIRGQALVDQYNNITLLNKGLAIQRDGTKRTSEAWFAYNKQIEDNKDLQAEIAQQIEIINIQGTAKVKKEVNIFASKQKNLNRDINLLVLH